MTKSLERVESKSIADHEWSQMTMMSREKVMKPLRDKVAEVAEVFVNNVAVTVKVADMGFTKTCT